MDVKQRLGATLRRRVVVDYHQFQNWAIVLLLIIGIGLTLVVGIGLFKRIKRDHTCGIRWVSG